MEAVAQTVSRKWLYFADPKSEVMFPRPSVGRVAIWSGRWRARCPNYCLSFEGAEGDGGVGSEEIDDLHGVVLGDGRRYQGFVWLEPGQSCLATATTTRALTE